MATAAAPPVADAKAADIKVHATATTPALSASADPTGLRQRKHASTGSDAYRADDESGEDDHKAKPAEEVTWGKTPSGTVFRVPQTHSFVHTLMNTFTRSSLTRWTLVSLFAQPALFFLLSGYPTLRSVLFLVYFAFWRSAYDFGFAWLLRKQSENKYIVRTLRELGWLDVNSTSGGEEGRAWARWWKRELEMKMGEGYTWESVPQEYNSWLIFRQLVDIVLCNDFTSYSLFAWSNLNFPANQGFFTHVFRWVFGWALIFFNLWVKMDAHRVVKDYAWYWGDAFWLMVMQHDLVFDGVYEIAPHPMYSVGYAGYYGLSIVVGSYTVLFVSLAAHAAQFAFLLWFENPHIDRTYGGAKKPLAARVPLDLRAPSSISEQSDYVGGGPALAGVPASDATTPATTEGGTETEPEVVDLPEQTEPGVRVRSDSIFSDSTDRGRPANVLRSRALSTSMHDLTYRFFRKPTIIFARLDPFRASDFALVVLVMYGIVCLIPALPNGVGLAAHFLHALAWRVFHSYGLGLLLRAQSKTKWLVRHYLNNYPYPTDHIATGTEVHEIPTDRNVVRRATEEAFQNWQVGYNISLVMTYVSFIGLAWKTYHLPSDWTVSGTVLRHVLGAALIALHSWSAVSIAEVLGDFGWFYSDFFLIEQVPARLAYHGIYRFLNNPERTLGGAAFLGLALISNSRLVFFLAVFSHLSHWWFLSFVEGPHMKKLYGARLRKDGGLTKTVKNMAGKSLANKKHIPELQRHVDKVRDHIEKVEAKVTHVVEDLIEQARPRWSELANDTKNLIEKSREHMTFTRVAKAEDMSAFDRTRYSITVASSSSAAPVPRYHVGQPISVNWIAPSNHSRKDWIGIYRVGASKSKLITNVSSMGKWVPIFEEEFDGNNQVTVKPEEQVSQGDAGTVTFRGNRLPWAPGKYELRYHHDGKHNVMSIISPIEIYVAKPSDMHSFRAVHDTVLNIVCLALDSNVSLVPRSARRRASSISSKKRHSLNLSTGASGTPRSPLGATTPLLPQGAATPLSPVSKSGTPKPVASAPVASALSSTEAPAAAYTKLPDAALAPTPVESITADSLARIADELDNLPSSPRSRSDSVALEDQLQDPDDFVIMDETQAKHITNMFEWAFGVELSTDVIIADANVTALTRRVIGARSLIDSSLGLEGASDPPVSVGA